MKTEFDFVVIVSQRHVTSAKSCFCHMFGLSPVFVISSYCCSFTSNVTTTLLVVFLTLFSPKWYLSDTRHVLLTLYFRLILGLLRYFWVNLHENRFFPTISRKKVYLLPIIITNFLRYLLRKGRKRLVFKNKVVLYINSYENHSYDKETRSLAEVKYILWKWGNLSQGVKIATFAYILPLCRRCLNALTVSTFINRYWRH